MCQDLYYTLTLTNPLDPVQAGCSVDEEMQATVPVSGSTYVYGVDCCSRKNWVLFNLDTSVATIVSVGEEPWPIDFPIVNHTVFFIVIHFCQLFRAEKKLVGVEIGVDLFGIFYKR